MIITITSNLVVDEGLYRHLRVYNEISLRLSKYCRTSNERPHSDSGWGMQVTMFKETKMVNDNNQRKNHQKEKPRTDKPGKRKATRRSLKVKPESPKTNWGAGREESPEEPEEPQVETEEVEASWKRLSYLQRSRPHYQVQCQETHWLKITCYLVLK